MPLTSPHTHGPDEDFGDDDQPELLYVDEDHELDCGCVVAVNHGEWDPELSTTCRRHTFDQAVRIAQSPPTRPR